MNRLRDGNGGRRKFGWLLAAGFAAALVGARALALEIEDYPEIPDFIHTLVQRHQFSEARLRALFAQVRVRPEIVQAMERPKEAALPWYEYRKLFLTDEHIRGGAKYWTRNAQTLARASERYGVAPEVIVAILGVETQYGRNRGDYPVMDALATLWLHYLPRSDFFRRELVEFLLLARELDVDPASIKGSYAGAIGVGQFIPSSYRRYAVDFDGDGRRDLMGSDGDVIGSVANFLNLHGWEAGQPTVDDVQLSGTLYFWIERLGLKPALTVSRLTRYGVVPRNDAPPERRAALIELEDEAGPVYRLGYNNFYVITRYNRSKRYAMAVVELAERLRRGREPRP